MTAITTDNRRFQRILFDRRISLEVADTSLQCELADISMRGALVRNCTGPSPDAGAKCQLIIDLDESSKTQIVMKGSIAHKEDNTIGVRCESIDLDSMAHLRRLVEINLADPALLEREFQSILRPD